MILYGLSELVSSKIRNFGIFKTQQHLENTKLPNLQTPNLHSSFTHCNPFTAPPLCKAPLFSAGNSAMLGIVTTVMSGSNCTAPTRDGGDAERAERGVRGGQGRRPGFSVFSRRGRVLGRRSQAARWGKKLDRLLDKLRERRSRKQPSDIKMPQCFTASQSCLFIGMHGTAV